MLYKGEKTQNISFPIGGIGTGSVGLSGNGRLVDWELFNKPNKASRNGYTCFVVRSKNSNGVNTKILHGDKTTDLMGPYINSFGYGFGFGTDRFALSGMPHFKHHEFDGRFPVASINFWDEDFGGKVKLTAFNPFIPLHPKESSLPIAIMEVEFFNDTDLETEYSVAFNCHNPFDKTINHKETIGNYQIVKMLHPDLSKSNKEYGEVAISCNDENAFVQEYWYRGLWQDNVITFWNEFSSNGTLPDRHYDGGASLHHRFFGDHASVGSFVTLKPNERKTFKFVMSWYVPHCYNYWNPSKDENGEDVTWKNYYATQFDSSADVIKYCFDNYDFLRNGTFSFVDQLFSSTLPKSVLDAISANLAVLKSPTVLRLENGEFYGWEGVTQFSGSCEGTCEHVWNYAYALCFLFPDLERSIRELEFKYALDENGHLQFRLPLPLGREQPFFRSCVDGHMGTVIKFYREWKLSGDDDFLKKHWKNIKLVLEYAWSDKNDGLWDFDKDGVLEGAQHNTLDMEVFGPCGWLQSFYLTALKAGAEMAKYLGENKKAKEYLSIYKNGKAWCEKNLFNGEYYIHKVDLKDKSIVDKFGLTDNYWNAEQNEIKYQIAEGCDIDQLCGQWHADIVGLGNVFDKKQQKTALNSLYKYNHLKSVRKLANPWRAFAVNDESATLMFTYPNGVYKPFIPITYCEESMHGFEYQFAGLLFGAGHYQKGLSVVKAIRDRYDGKKRNPWNEMEHGSNYARSMASFALLPIISGFKFDLPNKTIGFNPKKKGYFRSFFSVGTAWGNFIKDKNSLTVNLLDGKLDLCAYVLPAHIKAKALIVDGNEVEFTQKGNKITFNNLVVNKSLQVKF
jgi:uncharacterized protein (DUF608 family)